MNLQIQKDKRSKGILIRKAPASFRAIEAKKQALEDISRNEECYLYYEGAILYYVKYMKELNLIKNEEEN